MSRLKYMLKSEREKLVGMLAKDLGVDRGALVDVMRGGWAETRAGKLRVFVDTGDLGGSIFCRFEDPKRAAEVLHPGQKLYPGGWQRLNPCSGKWNFHFQRITAAEAFASFKKEFDSIRAGLLL
jgi:hypothetical protein